MGVALQAPIRRDLEVATSQAIECCAQRKHTEIDETDVFKICYMKRCIPLRLARSSAADSSGPLKGSDGIRGCPCTDSPWDPAGLSFQSDDDISSDFSAGHCSKSSRRRAQAPGILPLFAHATREGHFGNGWKIGPLSP